MMMMRRITMHLMPLQGKRVTSCLFQGWPGWQIMLVEAWRWLTITLHSLNILKQGDWKYFVHDACGKTNITGLSNIHYTLYIAARNVLTRVCLELNRPQLFNAMLSNEVDSFQCSLNKGTAFLLSNEAEWSTHELTDEEFWKPEPAYTLRFKQAKDTFLQIRSLQKKTRQ